MEQQQHTSSPGRFKDFLKYGDDGLLYDIALRSRMQEQPGTSSDHLAALEAIAAIRFACQSLGLFADRLASRHGVSDGRMQVLFLLLHEPGEHLSPGTIAEQLHVTPRTVTGLVDALERDRLVLRLPDPNDRRSLQVQLTNKGRSRAAELWNDAAQQQQAIMEGLSFDEIRQLQHLCLRVVWNIAHY